jgi:hypothetical protein
MKCGMGHCLKDRLQDSGNYREKSHMKMGSDQPNCELNCVVRAVVLTHGSLPVFRFVKMWIAPTIYV